MSATLSQIIGKIILSCERTDTWIISFGDSYLAVYNPMDIEPPEMANKVSAIVGLVVDHVTELESEIRINLRGHVTLRIDLRPEAYRGPEAMVFKTSEDDFIVW